MRLTADILLRADSYLNPVKDRELYLRGFKIPTIENLSVLQDQFDVIDFSDNEIRIFDNFPRMLRLTTLLVSNNYVFRVGSIGESLPNLATLVLTNNRIASLSEIDHLATLEKLELLSLMDNPVTENPHYRLYVVHKLPSLKSLDFRKITREERETAAQLFASAEGRDVVLAVEAEGRQEGSRAGSDSKAAGAGAMASLSVSQREQIRRAIDSAATKEEVDRIEQQLRTGSFVFADESSNGTNGHPAGAMEEA